MPILAMLLENNPPSIIVLERFYFSAPYDYIGLKFALLIEAPSKALEISGYLLYILCSVLAKNGGGGP